VNSGSSSNKSKLGLQSSGIQLKDKYRYYPTCMVPNYAISDIRSFKQSNAIIYIYTYIYLQLKKKARITFLARMKVCKMKMAEKSGSAAVMLLLIRFSVLESEFQLDFLVYQYI